MDKVTAIVATRSFDNEAGIMKRVAAAAPGEVIMVQGRNPSAQRNEGVKIAQGDILYFLDDDSAPQAGNIQKALEIFNSSRLAAVAGGPSLTPETDTLQQRCFGLTLANPLASGASSARYKKSGTRREATEKELILCNMFIRRDVFLEMNGFREELYPNEENEFLNRVKAAGYALIYDPEIVVYRGARRTFKDFIKQCFTYGRGRAEQVMVFFVPGDLVNFVPSLFVLYLFLAALGGFAGIVMQLPLLVYTAAVLYTSVRGALSIKNPLAVFLLAVDLPALHLSYGTGLLWGLAKHVLGGKKAMDRDFLVKRADIQK